MNRTIRIAFLIFFPLCLNGSVPCMSQQHYQQEILQHRVAYKEAFIKRKNSPIGKKDTGYIRFYKPNPVYAIQANVERVKDTATFQMPTYDGQARPYRKYAILHFRLQGQLYQLEAYQSLRLLTDPEHTDHLFVPFKDLTNYEATYGGGRYLDLSVKDIHENQLMLDFNKAYNPYCAYSSGYSCPIPPEENQLKIMIPAGEMIFEKKHKK